jgi:trehalose 6-phosphate phosphatase
VTVHLRRASEERSATVEQAVESLVEWLGAGELQTVGGKAVVEIRPEIPWDKGEAISALARARGDDCVPVYLGDDLSDEAGFRAINPHGVGIHVGDFDDTEATVTVADPEDVTIILRWLVDEGTALLDPRPRADGTTREDDDVAVFPEERESADAP